MKVPLARFPLTFQPGKGPAVLTVSADDGRFEMMVPAGSGRIHLSLPGSPLVWEGRVEPGATLSLDISFDAGIRVAGKVVSPANGAVAGVLLHAHGPAVPGLEYSVGADGGFSLFAGRPDAELTLWASAPGYAPSIPARLDGTADIEDLRLLLTKGGRVSGRVVDARNIAIAGAKVSLTSASSAGHAGPAAETDGAGQFLISSVRAGEYSPTAEAKGYFADAAGDVVLVKEGEESAGIVLTMSPACALRGRVVSSRGTPVAKAEIQVYEGGLTWSTESDHEGKFAFEALRQDQENPGIDRLECRAERHARVYRTSVAPEIECVLVLPDPAGVEVLLRPESGDFPADFSWALMMLPRDSPNRPVSNPGADIVPVRGARARIADLEPGLYELTVLAAGYKKIQWPNVTLSPGPAPVLEGVLTRSATAESPGVRVTRLQDPSSLRKRLEEDKDPKSRKNLLDFLRTTERQAPEGSEIRKTLKEVLKDYPE